MNKKFFVLAIIYWVVVAIVMVVLFNMFPQVAQSRWFFVGFVVLSLGASLVIRKLAAPKV
jgi:hypothetical protein